MNKMYDINALNRKRRKRMTDAASLRKFENQIKVARAISKVPKRKPNITISELVNFKRKGSRRRDLKKLSVSRIFPNPAIRNVNDKKAIQKYKILDTLFRNFSKFFDINIINK